MPMTGRLRHIFGLDTSRCTLYNKPCRCEFTGNSAEQRLSPSKPFYLCDRGGTGRHVRLRGACESMRVRFPPIAPTGHPLARAGALFFTIIPYHLRKALTRIQQQLRCIHITINDEKPLLHIRQTCFQLFAKNAETNASSCKWEYMR